MVQITTGVGASAEDSITLTFLANVGLDYINPSVKPLTVQTQP